MIGLQYIAGSLLKRAVETTGDDNDNQLGFSFKVSGAGSAIIALTVLVSAIIVLSVSRISLSSCLN